MIKKLHILAFLVLIAAIFSSVPSALSSKPGFFGKNVWVDTARKIKVVVSFAPGRFDTAVVNYTRKKGKKTFNEVFRVRLECPFTKTHKTADGVEFRFRCWGKKYYPEIRLPGWKRFRELFLKEKDKRFLVDPDQGLEIF